MNLGQRIKRRTAVRCISLVGCGCLLGAGLTGGIFWKKEETYRRQCAAYELQLETCLKQGEQQEPRTKGREVWIQGIELGASVQEGERLDIRISYANAEDYTVLADKEVRLLQGKTELVLLLEEAEILLLSSALADARCYPEVRLYAVRYPKNPEEQGTVNYLPNREVAELLSLTQEQMLERMQLERRLTGEQP